MESRLARNVNRNVATEGRDAGEVNGGPARADRSRTPRVINDGRSESGCGRVGGGGGIDEPLFFTSYFASVTTLQAVRRSWPVPRRRRRAPRPCSVFRVAVGARAKGGGGSAPACAGRRGPRNGTRECRDARLNRPDRLDSQKNETGRALSSKCYSKCTQTLVRVTAYPRKAHATSQSDRTDPPSTSTSGPQGWVAP